VTLKAIAVGLEDEEVSFADMSCEEDDGSGHSLLMIGVYCSWEVAEVLVAGQALLLRLWGRGLGDGI